MGLLGNLGTSLTLLLAHLSLLRAHREHKVHNIVLYPDKESWCKTTPIKQVVTWPQCAPQELDNNVCVGACFSYMVPHSEPSAPGDLIRPYCDSCQPLDSIWHTVTLDCKDKDDKPTTMQKKVQIITNCSCSSCAEASRIKPDLNSLLASLERGSGQHSPPRQQPASSPATASPESTAAEPQRQPNLEAGPAPAPDSSAAPGAAPTPAPSSSSPSRASASQQRLPPADADGQEAPAASEAPRRDAMPPLLLSLVAAPLQPAGAQATPPEQDAIETTGGGGGGGGHEAPDLLLNPNLDASRTPPGGPGAGGLQHQQQHQQQQQLESTANERFLRLLERLNDPALPADKLAKLHSLQKLDKLERLASEFSGAEELMTKLSDLLRKYSDQDEQSAPEPEPSSSLHPHHHHHHHRHHEDPPIRDSEDDTDSDDKNESNPGDKDAKPHSDIDNQTNDDDNDDDDDHANEAHDQDELHLLPAHQQQQQELEPESEKREDDSAVLASDDELQRQLLEAAAMVGSTSTSTTLTPPPELPAIAPKDPDDEEVPSLQQGQLRVAAALLHRTGPHHSLVLEPDADVKEKIDVESAYLQPALAGQEISYQENALAADKAKKKDF